MRGARILDLSEARTGAYAGRLLAAMGAEVVIGEPAEGSSLRRDRFGWEYLAAYKSSLALDDPVAAAAGFDAVIVSADGPTLEGSGRRLVDLVDDLRAAYPGLVVVSVTPFGLTGPYRDWRAGPLELWAAGGHLALTGDRARHPIPGGGAWESHLVGAVAAVAAQAALLEGQGAGRLIDVGAMEALAGSHQWSISLYTHTGYVKRRAGNRLAELHHPICLYPCSDGWVCIAAASLHQWEGLCIAMDQVELLADDSLASAAVRFDRADELDELIIAWTADRTVAEVVDACQGQFCPAGPVAELPELLDDPQLGFRDYWKPVPELGDAARMPGVPFVLPSTPDFSPAPAIGDAGPHPTPSVEAVAQSSRGASASAPDPTDAFRPLAGVRVVELTISWAGPLAGRFLADLGAEVIKVEHPTSRGVAVIPPDPDAERSSWRWGELPDTDVRNGLYPDADPGAEWWNRMSHWNKMNRSKRSLCLDVKGPGGREVLEKLVASADIVLNNYSPRGVRSLGIDHETLRAIKPDIVTVAMSGFGAIGPGAEAVSWGPILDAASGLAASTGYADSGPYKQGVAYPDPIGGTHGAAAILGAWWDHQRTGEAVHVDLSQLETLLAVGGDQALEASVTGAAPPRRGARSGRFAPAGVYPCAGNDRWLALTVYDDADWQRLGEVIDGLDDPAWRSQEGRMEEHDAIDAVVANWCRDRLAHQAMSELQDANVSASIVATNQDLVEDPHLAHRGFVVTVDHPAAGPGRFPGSLFLVDGRPLPIRAVSSLGADNASILAELGFDEPEQGRLQEAGTVATAPPS